MHDAESRYNAAITRMNAIRGDLNAVPVVHAYRLALKDALQALREVIAHESNPETRVVQHELLRTLKRLHYHLCVMEHCSVRIATELN
jgi:cell fate (sporulation/competence/biofilm development) regulator YmcA (YheA/YmcA/DUF963 family)